MRSASMPVQLKLQLVSVAEDGSESIEELLVLTKQDDRRSLPGRRRYFLAKGPPTCLREARRFSQLPRATAMEMVAGSQVHRPRSLGSGLSTCWPLHRESEQTESSG